MRDYDLFCRIVASGSLTAAGRELHLSPAMVSKRLTRLEQRLGAQLVHRSTRRLVITDAGRGFYEDATAILAAAAAAEARVSGAAPVLSGKLRIHAPTSFGRLHVAPHLKSFRAAYPDVRLELDLSDTYVDLVAGRVDIAIRITSQIAPGLVAHHLAVNRRILCASPAYLDTHGAPSSLEDLRRHALIAADNQTSWQLTSGSRTKSLAVESVVRTNSSEVARVLATEGHGIALRSLWDIREDLAEGRLIRVLDRWEGSQDVCIHAVHAFTSHVPPTVAAFINHLRETFAPVPAWESGLEDMPPSHHVEGSRPAPPPSRS